MYRKEEKGDTNVTLRLTQERLKRNWTQQEVAEMVGTTKQAVCNWEKNRSFPRRQVLNNLENLFGLSYKQLFAVADDIFFSSTN
ncbi:helix-turn-helix transcriptional regulator [Sinanaerobacter sp. ZZT-01]|uniref:helix-turn-helix domain-containing protein n=1 Tax=Sinanaerobacter sp. ZZT-01 TaxID=3111540 RepID=UPI002D78FEBC|nr:helix-turn-helix transcriptional regulator [Sinanaerobacter sp. ZZT-01]WRR94219.1 helix-turn-helix transcriptional regulator [Sinanaerobacter sp. ZZT-01]